MRRALWLGLALFSTHAFAADSCGLASGVYTGTYQDTTGLFSPQPFPLSLYLTEKAGKVYGYTLKSADSKGASYGQKPYALFWATCQGGQISQVYLIKNRANPCGDSAPGPWAFTAAHPLAFHVNYENTMINADLAVILNPGNPQKANPSLLSQALQLSQAGVASCH